MANDILKSVFEESLEKAWKENSECTEVDKRIIEAAVCTFSEKGYEGATTQAISSRAGISEKTLFKHFGSKENLFAKAVYPSIIKLIEPFIINRVDVMTKIKDKSLRDVLKIIAEDRIEFASNNPEIIKFFAQEVLLRKDFRDVFMEELWGKKIYPKIYEFIEQQKEIGAIRNLPTETIIKVLFSSLCTYVLAETTLNPGHTTYCGEELNMIIDMLTEGLEKKH